MLTATRTQSARPASAILPVVLVFLCGLMVGALLMRVWIHGLLHRAPNPVEITLDRWKHELNLSPSQTEQIRSILDDFWKYYDNVLADGNTRVLQVLDDHQKQQFHQLMKNRKR